MDRHTGFSAVGLRALMSRLAQPPTETAIVAELGDRDFYPVDDVIAFLRGIRHRGPLARLATSVRLTLEEITDAADHVEGYSRDRMLVLLRERIRYLMDRGATRNNPHIPESRLLQLVPADQVISADDRRPAHRLEVLVQRELHEMAAAREAATE